MLSKYKKGLITWEQVKEKTGIKESLNKIEDADSISSRESSIAKTPVPPDDEEEKSVRLILTEMKPVPKTNVKLQ